MMINRRELMASLVVSSPLFSEFDEWITLATAGTNKKGRVYDDFAIQRVAEDVKRGMRVYHWPESSDTGDLKSVAGIVTKSRYVDRAVQVKVNWFRGMKPVEKSWICIWGTAAMRPDKTFEFIQIEHLVLSSGGSTFAAATSV